MSENPNITKEVNKLIQLKGIFDSLFASSENTQLVYGAEEPYYQAASSSTKATIFSRDNFLSSALHEISHWIIAGRERRKKDDFGYWYEEEGRTKEQQISFEKVEIKPQAIEWVLSLACLQSFNFSADNLSQELEASKEFKQAVKQQAKDYLDFGLPERGECLLKEMIKAFRKGKPLLKSELNNIKHSDKSPLTHNSSIASSTEANIKKRFDVKKADTRHA